MRVVAIIAFLLLLGGAVALTWYITNRQCKVCPSPSPCPDCPDCPTPTPCPSIDCAKDCPCPSTDCAKDCPHVIPDTLEIDMTSTPPTAVFLGIDMEYAGDDPNQTTAKSAIFSYKGLPTVECYVTSGGMQIIQVNGYYDVNRPAIFAQITTVHGPGVYTDNKILPVSVKI